MSRPRDEGTLFVVFVSPSPAASTQTGSANTFTLYLFLVAAVTVGIVRKILTVICSLLLFSKPWANIYGVGGLLFAAALAQESRNARTREKLQHSRSSSDLADDEESPPPPAASPARRSPRIDVSK